MALPASVIIEKNKLSSADPFLLFFDITTSLDLFSYDNQDPVAGNLSASGLDNFNATNCVDENIDPDNHAFCTDTSVPGSYLKVDLGAGNDLAYRMCGMYCSSAGDGGTWDVEYSDNNIDWSKAKEGWAVNPTFPKWEYVTWNDVGAHRYWRWLLMDTPGAGPWRTEIQFFVYNSTETFYLVRNTEDVTRAGHLYTAFPIEVEIGEENSKGDVANLICKISNVTRALQAYVEELEGMNEDCQVTMRVVNAAHLADVALELTYDIIATQCDADWVTFTLGAPSPLRKNFPGGRYIADFCEWLPGGDECGVAAAAGVCKRRLSDCRSYDNSANFGGNPGMSSPTVRLA